MDLRGSHRLKDTLPPSAPPQQLWVQPPHTSACISVSCLLFAVRGRQTDRSRLGSACPLHCLSPLCAPSPPACLPRPTLHTGSSLPLLSPKVMSPSLRRGQLYVSSSCHLAISHAALLWSRQLSEGLRLEGGSGFPPGLLLPSPLGWKRQPQRDHSFLCLRNTFPDSGLLLVFRSPLPCVGGPVALDTHPLNVHTQNTLAQLSLLRSLYLLSPWPLCAQAPGQTAVSLLLGHCPSLSCGVFVSGVCLACGLCTGVNTQLSCCGHLQRRCVGREQSPEASCPGPVLPAVCDESHQHPAQFTCPMGLPQPNSVAGNIQA